MNRDGAEPQPPAAPDPGLQPERTRLAWRRTVLAITVVAVLTGRLAPDRGVSGALAVVVALAVGGGAAAALLLPRISHRGGPGPAVPLSALVTAGYALLGVLIIMASLG